jgi:hypothetical protein
MNKLQIKKLLVFATVCCAYSFGYSGCTEVFDTIGIEPEAPGDGIAVSDGKRQDMKVEHEIHKITFAGVGIGYVDNEGFKDISYNFFLSRLWEVWRYGAIRAAGELITDLNDAVIADITLGVNVYPFQYGTTPYAGIEIGYGFGNIESGTNFGIYGSGEIGVFAIKISSLMLASSARIFLMRSSLSGEYPIGFIFRVGLLL